MGSRRRRQIRSDRSLATRKHYRDRRQFEHVFVCGTSELTLALCADLTRRKLEYDYYSEPGETALPALTLVGEDAEEYLRGS